MHKLETTIVINRPIEDVFNYTTDINKHAEWRENLVEAKLTSPGSAQEGATYVYTMKFMGQKIETVSEVIEHQEPTNYKWKATNGPFPLSGSMSFEPAPDGTRVTERIEAEPGGFFKLAEPVILRQQRSQMEQSLQNLKRVMEQK
jgi:uncharacterized membrane protein